MDPLLPVLPRAFAALGLAPERDASRVAPSPLALAGGPAMALDGPERRRQRPTHAAPQREQDSGQKKTPTEKHPFLGKEPPHHAMSRGPTVARKTHAKQGARR